MAETVVRTPSPQPMRKEVREICESDDEIQIVSVDDLAKIPRIELENPFIENKPNFQSSLLPQSIDLATHMELVNHRTGKKIVRELSDEERKFKPRKLLFARDADYDIANKYLDSSMGKKFTMETGKSSNLGFSIFSDED